MTTAIDNKSLTSLASELSLLHDNLKLPEIEYVAVSDVKLPKRRLKQHSEGLIASLVSSIETFGIVTPLLVDAALTIVDGEAVFEAGRRLGLRSVPILRLDHLDANQIRVLRLTLKNLAKRADWSAPELAIELKELVELELDISLDVIGFDPIEFDAILSTDNVADADEQSPPMPLQPGAPVSMVGDLWILGQHRLLNASSLERGSFVQLMKGELARIVIADLPYNVRISGHVCGLGRHKHREFVQGAGEMSETEFEAL